LVKNMAPELGQISVILALMLALAQAVVPLSGAARGDRAWMRAGATLATGQLLFVVFAFAMLCYGFLNSDFSIRIIAENSHSLQPTLFKFAGAWGNHEGSMLLWVMILAIFGGSVAIFGNGLPATLKARVLAVQGMIGAAFLAFIVFTSNPFDRLNPAPLEGAELNPLLQDPGLAFHPPFLYLGYVGFSMAFSFSVAALLEGRVDAAWARWVRPWVLAAWCFLTVGIAMGSLWAYYELGWGGWWYWDPVENASFMPWLVGTALLHSALVVERRQSLVNWTILLGILTFSLSLIGTFLVRSGVLTSVHAFALDPARGVFILAILLAASMGALGLYAWRAPSLAAGPTFAPMSREGALVLNNIFLVCAAATVFLGTFYPLFIDAIGGDKISVGPPYFKMTFAPIMTPMLIAMSAGPIMKWRKDGFSSAASRLKFAALVSVTAFVLLAVATGAPLSAFGLAIAVWLAAGAAVILFQRVRIGAVPMAESLRLAMTLPGATAGLILGHASMGVCVAGIVAMSSWAKEEITMLAPGESLSLSGYEFRLDSVGPAAGPNFEAERAIFSLRRKSKEIGSLTSERRYYPARGSETTEAGIRSNPFVNLYVAIGDERGGRHVVRAYVHPLAGFIWLGALGMAGGGVLSLTDRRFRLGARAKVGARHSSAAALPAE
jgi:cytochrome c-type biogenesis protein CcmF